MFTIILIGPKTTFPKQLARCACYLSNKRRGKQMSIIIQVTIIVLAAYAGSAFAERSIPRPA